MPNEVKESYENGECPDCGREIPDDVISGETCKNCDHMFCTLSPCDDDSLDGWIDEVSDMAKSEQIDNRL